MRRVKKSARARARTRARQGRSTDWQSIQVHYSTSQVGPDVVTPDHEQVMRALQSAPRGDDWKSVGALVIPVIPRVRPYPPGYPAPLRTIVPPGITVSFGVDIGPAFMAVSRTQLDVLGITELDLMTQSLANLKTRAGLVVREDVVRQHVDGVPIKALQTGRSIGSTLVLVPEELGRIFGREPSVFMAPMRDVLLGFPLDSDPTIAADLYETIASQDPNCLPPTGYIFDGHTIVIAELAAEAPIVQRLLA